MAFSACFGASEKRVGIN